MLPPIVAVYRANDMAPWEHMYVKPGLTEPKQIPSDLRQTANAVAKAGGRCSGCECAAPNASHRCHRGIKATHLTIRVEPNIKSEVAYVGITRTHDHNTNT